MTSYLLLRNNKESGPYSLEEIVRFGLKPYDLVWVNGKSAAWRYPGEVTELQPYAPTVEEQPYDRFYKKNGEEKTDDSALKAAAAHYAVTEERSSYQPVKTVAPAPTVVKQEIEPLKEREIEPVEEIAVVAQAAPVIPEERIIAPASTPVTPKKSVFVTLPQGRAPQPAPAPAETQATSKPAAFEKYMPAENLAPAAAASSAPAKTITITENPVAAEIKYSQPLDEIKEMYVKTLQERKQRIANKVFLLQTAKKIAVVIAIVGAGFVIGFTMRSNGNKKLVAASEKTATPAIAQDPVDTTTAQQPSTQIVQDELLSSVDERSSFSEPARDYSEPATKTVQKQIEDQEEVMEPAPVTTTEKKKTTQAAATAPEIKEPIIQDIPAQPVDVNEKTGERSRKVRSSTDEETAKPVTPRTEKAAEPKAVMTKNLMSQVSVKSNEYKIVSFGGIRDLQLTLYNDSKYVLDKVLVELQYLKPSEEPLRIDVITFRSVSPNGSLTIRMPDTNRGIKVRYRILSILSTQSAKDMADL